MKINWGMTFSVLIALVVMQVIRTVALKKVKTYADGSRAEEKEAINIESK